jgi:hypothetical protein
MVSLLDVSWTLRMEEVERYISVPLMNEMISPPDKIEKSAVDATSRRRREVLVPAMGKVVSFVNEADRRLL